MVYDEKYPRPSSRICKPTVLMIFPTTSILMTGEFKRIDARSGVISF